MLSISDQKLISYVSSFLKFFSCYAHFSSWTSWLFGNGPMILLLTIQCMLHSSLTSWSTSLLKEEQYVMVKYQLAFKIGCSWVVMKNKNSIRLVLLLLFSWFLPCCSSNQSFWIEKSKLNSIKQTSLQIENHWWTLN